VNCMGAVLVCGELEKIQTQARSPEGVLPS
jgi:hypothetical protein